MSLSKAQKAMVKMAQREAGLSDGEYRQVWRDVAGVDSSTDARLGDRDFDRMLAYMEAIFWRAVDKVGPPKGGTPNVFRVRGYWAGKNTKVETSRDRFSADRLAGELDALEREAVARGLQHAYLDGIRKRSGGGWKYRAALRRTLKLESSNTPF